MAGPNPITYMRVSGKTAGSNLADKLKVLNNVSIANAFRNIGDWIQSVGIGARSFNGVVHAGGTPSSQTVTFASFVAGDTVTINGVVFTGSDTASTNVQIKTGAGTTNTTVALSFANLINSATAPAKILGVVQATAALAVTTLTWMEPGAIGNLGTAAISAHGSVGGATFTSGADGTITLLAKGI